MIASKKYSSPSLLRLQSKSQVTVCVLDRNIQERLEKMWSHRMLTHIDFKHIEPHQLWQNEHSDLIIFDTTTLNIYEGGLGDLPPCILLTSSEDDPIYKKNPIQKVSDYLFIDDLSPALLSKSIEYTIKLNDVNQKLYNKIEDYHQFIENNTLPVLIVDLTTQEILKANQAAVDLYGYSKDELQHISIRDIRPPEDIEIFEKTISGINDEAQTEYPNTFRHLTKDGQIIYVELKGMPISIKDRRVRMVLIEDVSDQMQSRDRLIESERRFKALVQNGSDIIALLSANAKLLYISPSIERVLGLKQEGVMDTSLFDFLHPDDVPLMQKTHADLPNATHQIKVGPYRVKNTDGDWRWLETTFLNKLNDSAINGIVASSRDITNQIQNQQKLEASIIRYKNIVDVASDIIYEFHLETREMKFVSNHSDSLFDYQNNQSLTRADWELLLHPEDRNNVIQYMSKVLANNEINQGLIEYRLRKKNGKYAHFQDRFFVLNKNDGHGQIQGALQDISLRKTHESIQEFENNMLTLYAKDNNEIKVVLEKALLAIETLIDGAMCSILKLTKGNCARHLSAPSIPPAYSQVIDGVSIGPKVGSCGTAMYEGSIIIVEDIATNPLWEDYKEIALKFGLKSCWSVPIKHQNGKVIGSFATYYNAIRKPDSFELELIQRAANVLGIIMENWQAREDLKQSNERYDIVARATNDIIWEYNLATEEMTSTEGLFQKFGYNKEEDHLHYKWWLSKIHPADKENVTQTILKHLRNDNPQLSHKYRFKTTRGDYRYILERLYVIKNDNQMPIRIIGAMEDITDKEKYLREIEKQNLLLKQISWDQSHKVRAPLARIMGLLNVMEATNKNDFENDEVLRYLSDSSKELDQIVRGVVSKIELMKNQPA
ncbi:PAS domain S-box [Owenweeksia hongkongensis DSM 17368]|uniref:histidine kinase n=1 Tax=Owenweeksia hongkongensis (strain DSM 17368 / CIP 108786 / JCM 12287 / NRRL B-23963 / UST20020801) TaxID=926562 RepID=G8R007_OWEHD|nr:PAS domain-containing protein [Owenweeksia hongkongensis]AEV32647.1 PAS domain S-box [Owenweeksia hongkongensis DSM 17368]